MKDRGIDALVNDSLVGTGTSTLSWPILNSPDSIQLFPSSIISHTGRSSHRSALPTTLAREKWRDIKFFEFFSLNSTSSLSNLDEDVTDEQWLCGAHMSMASSALSSGTYTCDVSTSENPSLKANKSYGPCLQFRWSIYTVCLFSIFETHKAAYRKPFTYAYSQCHHPLLIPYRNQRRFMSWFRDWCGSIDDFRRIGWRSNVRFISSPLSSDHLHSALAPSIRAQRAHSRLRVFPLRKKTADNQGPRWSIPRSIRNDSASIP